MLPTIDHRYLANLAGTNAPVLNDDFWRDLDRRNVQRYRAELDKAPRVLVVRQSHYDSRQLAPTGGNMHYSWLDNRMANLSVTFEDLVSYGYTRDATVDPHLMARTEFPDDWYHGRLTNRFDVISTIRVRSVQRLQADIKTLLKDQFGLAWHYTTRRHRRAERQRHRPANPRVQGQPRLRRQLHHVRHGRRLGELLRQTGYR